MAHSGIQQSGLNPLQVSLLRLFSRPMSNEETLKLKRILVQNFATDLKSDLEKVVISKDYQKEDFDKMLRSVS